MADIFEGAKLKVDRAEKHIAEVEQLITEFASSNLHKLNIKLNADTGLQEIVFESSHPFPKSVNLAVGDAVHNLRSALDHTMMALIYHLDPDTKIDDIHFPMRVDRKAVIEALRNPVLTKAMGTDMGKLAHAVILDKIQPYGTREKPIRMLNKMDNIDKHRFLITLFTMSGMTGTGRIGAMNIIGSTLMSYRGTPVITSPGIKIVGDFKPAIEIRLNEAKLPPYEPLIPTLHTIVSIVREAINAIESCVVTQ
jgi:hypothetical protein